MATTTKKPAQATKKDTTAPAKKAPAKITASKSTAAKPKAPAKPVATVEKKAPAKKAPAKAKPAPVMASAPTKDTAADVKNRKAATAASAPAKKAAPKPKKDADLSKMETNKESSGAKTTSTGKTAYHVSKRDNDGREWKVFIQGSDKVIKLFKTQVEALDYAKGLAKNKDGGSYVILHGLDGKIRRY